MTQTLHSRGIVLSPARLPPSQEARQDGNRKFFFFPAGNWGWKQSFQARKGTELPWLDPLDPRTGRRSAADSTTTGDPITLYKSFLPTIRLAFHYMRKPKPTDHHFGNDYKVLGTSYSRIAGGAFPGDRGWQRLTVLQNVSSYAGSTLHPSQLSSLDSIACNPQLLSLQRTSTFSLLLLLWL